MQKIRQKSTMVQKCFLHITDENSPISIIEDSRDYQTGMMLNNSSQTYTAPFNMFVLATVNPIVSKKDIEIMEGKDIYFFSDNHQLSYSLHSVALQLQNHARCIKIINLREFLENFNLDEDLQNEATSLDLSTALSLWNNGNIDNFINLLHFFADSKASYVEEMRLT